MQKQLLIILLVILGLTALGFTQTNQWMTQYVTFDASSNGTGYRTASVAAIGPNRFVALVTGPPILPDNFFAVPYNYLVGYWDADSAAGRVPSPINGSQTEPRYGVENQYTDWEYVLDKVTLKGAWQIAADNNGYVYVANNDDAHNILVFELTQSGVNATPYRMMTGSENIWGIEVDDSGYVYVLDYEGRDDKDNEVKVFAGINTPGTTWGEFNGHNDSPVATIDLPPGIYQGITVNNNGTEIYISATSQRSVWKFVGDPVNGYTRDTGFNFTLAENDTAMGGLHPSVLGLAYLDDPHFVFAATDTFLNRGATAGYSYGRIYVLDAPTGMPMDTIDIAQWNFDMTGMYDTGSNNGRVGGFTSVWDVDVEKSEKAVYTQTYYGWAVEKWVFDGDLGVLNIEQVSATVPRNYQLKQNYPNPFNPTTTIEFSIKQSGFVSLNIYNVMGQKVATLINNNLPAGTYQVVFDAGQLAAGIYFYQLVTDDFRATKKMILSK